MIVTGTYDPALVALSIVVAVIASYAALDLGSRLLASPGWKRLLWLALAAVAMGGGIWSMHFIAMLAFILPIPVEYEFKTTVLSLLAAVLATGAGFYVVGENPHKRRRLLAGGVLIGAGILGMHYTGMSAMLMQCALDYDPLLVGASVLIAIAAATGALWLAFRTRSVWQRLLAAGVMGAAVSGMHYTGMAAAMFSATTPPVAQLGYAGPGHIELALAVAGLTFMMLFIALFASAMDRQLVHESEESLVRLYRETPLPLHSLGLDGKLQKVSDACLALLGYARAEVIGRELAEFMTIDSAVHYRSATLPHLLAGREVHEAEYQFVKKSGEVVDALLSARLIVKPPAIVGGLIDVTTRKRAEEALRQAQRMEAIGQITGGVAHDFNNLLMIISGSAAKLRQLSTDLAAERPFEMIATAVKRAQSLTNHLLAFSRKQTLDAVVVDLNELVPKIGDTLRRSLRGDIEVVVDADCTNCRTKVDAGELELALLNLGVNARDAMPNGGTISISLRTLQLNGEGEHDGLQGAFAVIDMKDTGAGIAPDVLKRVFEPFFTTKGPSKGTGLGLSQVYGFSKQSGGSTIIRSRPGRGTIVSVYLPLTEEGAVNQRVAPELPSGPGTARGCVLLVEDSPEVAGIVAQYLLDLGYTVDAVRDGSEALTKLQENRFYTFVLSDILMPGAVGGLDLARIMRERMPHLPILLSTGYSEKIKEAGDEGFAIIRKPYELSGLRAAVIDLISRPRAPLVRNQTMDAAE